jgi:16S rRNA (guanine527-N7)-methyltransferase
VTRRQAPSAPEPTATWLRDRLGPRVRAEGAELSAAAAELLARYLALLLPWNARVNLTAARTAAAIVDDHLADGVALLGQLPPGEATLVDVGAGAGFVGVAVAVLRPDLRCVLLEPSRKRYAFLRAVARELPLRNVEARPERLEDHLARPDAGAYDVAVSRATWAPGEWLARAEALLGPGGLAVAFEGGRQGVLARGVERLPRADGRGSLLIRRIQS